MTTATYDTSYSDTIQHLTGLLETNDGLNERMRDAIRVVETIRLTMGLWASLGKLGAAMDLAVKANRLLIRIVQAQACMHRDQHVQLASALAESSDLLCTLRDAIDDGFILPLV